MPNYDWVYNNQCTEVMGWQDYHFLSMSQVEDETFEHPGPASGRRGEWPLSTFQLLTLNSFSCLQLASSLQLLTNIYPLVSCQLRKTEERIRMQHEDQEMQV